MIKVAIGLGSNLGDRQGNLRQAAEMLKAVLQNIKLSSFIETPALLPKDAPDDWDKPFLNAALIAETSLSAHELLGELQAIENKLGRKKIGVWSPRSIDLDILFYGDEIIDSADLQVPHPQMLVREFVMQPLREIATDWLHPSMKAAKIMAIVNVTPDSFSDGYSPQEAISHAKQLLADGADILDIGAESTRPNAIPVTPDEEWQRLEPVIKALRGQTIISVDTRHAETAQKALALGVNMINDVSAASNDALLDAVAANPSARYVLMHSLSVPADKNMVISDDLDVVQDIMSFAQAKLDYLSAKGISRDRVIFDVGIGFGKTAEQSLELIEHIAEFKQLNVPLLVGHSRKSFLSLFSDAPAAERDELTLKFSQRLAADGVDYLRVHNVILHKGKNYGI